VWPKTIHGGKEMNERIETLSLVQLYDKFRDPIFVKNQNHVNVENGEKMFTLKTTVFVPKLGMVTFCTAYLPRNMKLAKPALFLSEQQVRIINKNGIRFRKVMRKNAPKEEKYLCFLNRKMIEKIESL
jgi:hypothetical protein